jgi:hypothetical protein
MDCWPVKLVGTFFLALIVYDFIEAEWEQVPPHTIIGILITGLFLGLCALVGEGISGAVLVVPLLMLAIFLFATYMFKRALARKGCCIKCTGKDSVPIEPSTNTNTPSSTTPITPKKEDECGKLSLTPVV